MDIEQLKIKFITGCKRSLGDIIVRPRTLVCVLNDTEKIVLDKKGRWVKSYAAYHDGHTVVTGELTTWGIPKDIKLHHKGMIIELKSPPGKRIETDVTGSDHWFFGYISWDPFEIAPEFKELYLRRKKEVD